MDKRNFAKIAVRILIAAALITAVVLLFLNRNRFYSPDRCKGGYGVSPIHANGMIKRIDAKHEKIIVSVDKDSSLLADWDTRIPGGITIILDCAYPTLDWDTLEIGQKINFSYLTYNPSTSEANVIGIEKLEMP